MVYPVFAAQTTGAASTMNYSYNGTPIPPLSSDIIHPVYGDTTREHFKVAKSLKAFTLDDTDKLSFQVDYSCPGTVKEARLDFITVNYERQLALKNGYLAFGLDMASRDTTYLVAGCTGSTRVWDVTCPFALVQQNVTVTDGIASFSPATSGRREFIAFDETNAAYSHPMLVGEVANQNIHGQATPDMIILAPAAYLEQAQRVATLHERYDHFSVLVLDHEQVFNEFSSGTPDAMAYRRLCKMFYDRGESQHGHRLQYLLLFGGGSYDNRLLETDANSLDHPNLLTWQSEASDIEEYSFTTDDFFAMLDDSSGINPSDTMNIAVGRMIVRNEDEARTAVDKLEKYITQPDYGSWKNRIMFVADDGNHGSFMEQSNNMIQTARTHGGENMSYNYVYIDAFDAVYEGGKWTYPDARDKMYGTLNDGVLWWNYNGHASPQEWTSEGLLTSSDVDNLLNYSHLPVLYTSSCEFCRFDNATVSSGERIFLKANGGAIAVITPARLAFLSQNGNLNNAVARHIFAGDESGRPKRIGDIIRLAKNEVNHPYDDNKLRFFVFGDPAMRLAYAPMTARVETINGKAVDAQASDAFVFKAGDEVEFGGKIIGLDGETATGFNGTVISTLYGPEQSVTTHGYGWDGKKITYDDRPDRLAITMDTVVGGEFMVRVTIPSEVNNEYDNFRPALINLYAYDSRDTLEAKGSNSNFYIYGNGDVQEPDTIGPDIITMVLNDESFIDGNDVNPSPMLLATVADESGVNLSPAGSEHSMALTLDGNTIYNDLVNYYTPLSAQHGTLGNISYQLNDLPEGMHSLTLSVWDVHNNVSEKTITFNTTCAVSEITAPEDLYIYCAFDGLDMTFYVRHHLLYAEVSMAIEVYDLMGRCVWQSGPSGRSGMFTVTPVTWNMRNNDGMRVPSGIYIYRATITADGVQMATRAQKLAVPAY